MKAKLFCLLVLVLIQTPILHAGEGGSGMGNGGDAVVCRNSKGNILSAEPLDIFEARVLRGIDLKLDTHSSVETAYNILIRRLGVFSPLRAKRYQSFYTRFVAELKMLDVSLVDIPDSDHLVFPTGCKVEQLVIQQVPPTPYDARFLVQKQIWNTLSGAQQAVIVLHEALLEEAMSNYDELTPSETIQTRELRFINSLVFGFNTNDYYSKITEATIVKALLSIPNFYTVELRRFGEITGRRGSEVVAIQGYDENGFVDKILLLGNPITNRLHHEIGNLVFDGFYPDGGTFLTAHSVQFLTDGNLRVGSRVLNGSRLKPGYQARSMTAEGKMHISFPGRNDPTRMYCYPDMDIDPIKLTVNGLHAIWLDGICLPPKGWNLGPIVLSGIERVRFDVRMKTLSNGHIQITYTSSKNDGSARDLIHFILPHGISLPLITDEKEHVVEFDSQGMPLDRQQIFLERNRRITGIYDPSAPVSARFLVDPLLWNENRIRIQAQPLPDEAKPITYLTADPFGVVWRHNRNKTKCIPVPVGTSFPDKIPSPSSGQRWWITGELCSP